MWVGFGSKSHFSKEKFHRSGHLTGKNFQEKETNSYPDIEKRISGNKGKRQATLQVPCGCSTAILCSTLEDSASREELEREKGVRKNQALWEPKSTYHPPPTDIRSDKSWASCSIPALQTSTVICSSGQNVSLSSQRSPGKRALESQRHRQRRPTPTVLYGYIIIGTHTTGTQAPQTSTKWAADGHAIIHTPGTVSHNRSHRHPHVLTFPVTYIMGTQ